MPNVVFAFHLDRKILPGLVTLGTFAEEDDAPSLAAVTTGNKIHVHDLRASGNRTVSGESVRSLNFVRPVTDLRAVRFEKEDRDCLLVCTGGEVFAYDLHENRDVFVRTVPDGGNVLGFGTLAASRLVLVGGNCSVQGFDKNGTDLFWIVTGDNVRSLALVDVDDDGEDELVVGSDDYDIRIFKNDDLLHEITETQIVTHLLDLGGGLFAYALANGTVGVYERLDRLWRVKSKNRATCLHRYDVNGDGVPELVTGWQGGKVDGRNVKTGEVLFKDNFEHTVAGICEGDCRNEGRNDLIVVSITGEVRGYNPHAPGQMRTKAVELSYEQETIRELLARKQSLLLEMKNYESDGKRAEAETDEERRGAIPARTRLQTSIGVSAGSANRVAHVQVGLSTNNETVIRTVIVFAEGMFKGETHVEHPRAHEATHKLDVSLYPPRDVPIDVHIKALVGHPKSEQFHVFELTRQLPRFSMYAIASGPPSRATSSVSFLLNERVQRVVLWINRNFLLPHQLDINATSELKLCLTSLRDGEEVSVAMEPRGRVKIQTDNIALAGDLVQSLATYLNLESVKSNADFPKEEEKCLELLEKLKELDRVKGKLDLDLGDKSNLIRNLLVRSEDARILEDWKLTRLFYKELEELNGALESGHEIRVANYGDAVNAIKELNGIVQKASRLRFGKYKSDPVTLSRNAIKTNNGQSLIKAIRTGEA